MKVIRILMLGVIVGVVGFLVSCGKEETPADKINNTTQAMEKKIETLKKDVEEKKAEEVGE